MHFGEVGKMGALFGELPTRSRGQLVLDPGTPHIAPAIYAMSLLEPLRVG
jgi:hypothetical protein